MPKKQNSYWTGKKEGGRRGPVESSTNTASQKQSLFKKNLATQ